MTNLTSQQFIGLDYKSIFNLPKNQPPKIFTVVLSSNHLTNTPISFCVWIGLIEAYKNHTTDKLMASNFLFGILFKVEPVAN